MRLLKIYPKLVLLIVALTFSTTALAYDEWAVDIDHLTYGLDKTNKTATVSKRESYTYTEINIPSKIKIGSTTYTVTAIADRAFDTTKEGSDFSPITSVTIPATVETIGEKAFKNCSGLTSIKIPASVKSIGKDAFYKTDDASSNLTTVEFEEGSVLETIGEYAFYGCYKLKGVKIPASVKSIGKFAFSAWGKALGEANESSSLTTVEFEENSQLETIGNAAFQDCQKLTRIVIPEGVKNIGSSAFLRCSALEYAEIPSTVTDVGHSAFRGCTNVKVVSKISAYKYDNNGTGWKVFGNSQNAKIYVPSSLKSGYESRKSDLGVTSEQIVALDEINVTVSKGGYATLCYEYPLDFKGSGLKAYVVDINSSAKDYVVLSEVTNKNIKKETALILRGEPSKTYTIFKAVDEGVEAGNEYLFGTVEAAGVVFTDIQNKDEYKNSTLYILAEPNDNVGFYKPKPAADGGTNTILNQYRACLLWPNELPKSENLPSTAPKNAINIVVDNGGTTEIEHIYDGTDNNIHNGNRTVYNLNGQRVGNPGKGLYIVNGKKIVIK